MTTPSKLLTAQEVADRLGISSQSVYQMSYRGQLPGRVKLGQRVRWQEAAIDAVVANGLPGTAKENSK